MRPSSALLGSFLNRPLYSMKLAPIAALCTTAASGLLSRPAFAWSTSIPAVRHASTTFLNSMVTPNEETFPTALQPQGNPVANGTVVSFFRGGLAAIQVRDDLLSTGKHSSQGK